MSAVRPDFTAYEATLLSDDQLDHGRAGQGEQPGQRHLSDVPLRGEVRGEPGVVAREPAAIGDPWSSGTGPDSSRSPTQMRQSAVAVTMRLRS